MIIGIHKNRLPILLDNELKIYTEILKYNKIEFIELDCSDPGFWSKVRKVNFFIYKWGHDHHSRQKALSIIPVIEKLNIKCFPDIATCWHYDDKVKQYYLLRENGFPVTDTFIFWEKDIAMEWIRSYNNFPLVFKLANGAGSMNVKLIKTRKEAKRLIKRMFGKGIDQDNNSLSQVFSTLNYDIVKIFRYYAINFRNNVLIPERRQYWQRHKNYVYFQQFLPENKWDTRVTTAGSRAHAFRRFIRPNDFRASGSNHWDINPGEIDLRMVKTALDISKCLGFQAMAYDFIYNENKEPRIIEMSYLYGGAGYPDFMNGYWDEDLAWHEGRYWPQYFELYDLLGNNDLKMPAIETSTAYKKARII